MIPLWAFLVSCVVFLLILAYQYLKERTLATDLNSVALVLSYYIQEYGFSLLENGEYRETLENAEKALMKRWHKETGTNKKGN